MSVTTHTEEWRDVVGYEGLYQVSSLGRVRRVERTIRKFHRGKTPYDYHVHARIMTGSASSGYFRVMLGRKTFLVHQLVAEAFIGPRPKGNFVCHVDGSKTNNHVGNLRYDTPAGNSADMEKHGTLLLGTKNHLAKLTPDAVRYIRSQRGIQSGERLGTMFGVTRQAIGFVQRRAVWRHIP